MTISARTSVSSLWVLLLPALLSAATRTTLENAAAEPDEGGPIPIQVGLCDTTGLTSVELDEVRAEAAGLFSPGGVEILWSDSDVSCTEERPAQGPPYATAYILDALLPSIQAFFPSHNGSNVMAVTLGRDSQGPGPMIHVSRNAVEEIARVPSGNLARRIVTRALGRVLAHELAHRFLSSEGHSKNGILKAVLTRDDLIYASPDTLALSPDETRGAVRLTAHRARSEN
jgi:hypothetical protein